MLEELHLENDKGGRPLFDSEKGVVQALIGPNQHWDLDDLRVLPIGDSGMHSLSFINADQFTRQYGGEIGQATYVDADGVLVSISLSIDETGRLFELDFWKVDFNPLRRYPDAAELDVKSK